MATKIGKEGTRGFQKGHPLYARKRPGTPGRPRDMNKVMRNLAVAVRENLPADVMYDWWQLQLEGHAPIIMVDDDSDEKWVSCECCDEDGVSRRGVPRPDLAQRNEAMTVLMNRGYGLPAQAVQIQGLIQHDHVIPNPVLDELPLAALDAVVQAIQSAYAPASQLVSRVPSPASIIDVVDVVDVEDAVELELPAPSDVVDAIAEITDED